MKPKLQIVLPVLNEEISLEKNVLRLYKIISNSLTEYEWTIIIIDNGSIDRTIEIAYNLSNKYSEISFSKLELKGRGRAIRTEWMKNKTMINCYMDIDLSTDLSSLPEMIELINKGKYELVVGSRLLEKSIVNNRPLNREIISRIYSLLVRVVFLSFRRPLYIKDFQCGFKAISPKLIQELLPYVQDNGWFFDSELILLANNNGYKIKEIPVQWTDDPDSRVKIITTAIQDLLGMIRLKFGYMRKVKKLICNIHV